MSDFSITFNEPVVFSAYSEYDNLITHNSSIMNVDIQCNMGYISKNNLLELFKDQSIYKNWWINGITDVLNAKDTNDSVGKKILEIHKINVVEDANCTNINYMVDLTKFSESLVNCNIENIESKFVAGKKFQII